MLRTDAKTLVIALLKGREPYSTQSKQSAINLAITNSLLKDGRGVPGEVIKHLPKEIRNILIDCKSKDWNHRLELIKWMIT